MELLAGVCPQCGASIEFDASLLRGFCPFCQTEFLVKDVMNGAANMLVNAGETRLKLGDYTEALEKFEKVCDLYPSDYRGWWGMIKVKSRNLTNTDINQRELDEMFVLYEKAKVVSDGKLDKYIKDAFASYVALVKDTFAGIITRTNNQIDLVRREKEKVIADLDKRIADLRATYSNMKNPVKIILWSVVAIVAVLTLLSALSDILTAFYVLIICGGIGYGIVWLAGVFLAPKFNTKRRKCTNEIEMLERQKADACRRYDSQIAGLEEKLINAGYKK